MALETPLTDETIGKVQCVAKKPRIFVERIVFLLVLRQGWIDGFSWSVSAHGKARLVANGPGPLRGVTQPWALTGQLFGRYCGVPPLRYST